MGKNSNSISEKLSNLFRADQQATVALLQKTVSVNDVLKESVDIPTKSGNSSDQHFMTVSDILGHLCDCNIELHGEFPSRPNNPGQPKKVVTSIKVTAKKTEEKA